MVLWEGTVWKTMPFGLIIFDCDGVLIDSELISAKMLISTLDEHGVTVDLAYVAHHFLGRSYPTVLKQIKAEFGVNLSEEFELEYRKRLLRSFDTELQAASGIGDVLDNLSVKYCVATSSSPERVQKSLNIVGIRDRFQGNIFTSSQVANGKPAPDLFIWAAKQMGVAPENCLVIEDSLNGIKAALAAKMTVWRYTGGSHIDDVDRCGSTSQKANFAFDDFSEFYMHVPDLMKSEAK